MTPLSQRPNLGRTIVGRLADVGITDTQALRRIGPARAYRRMAARSDRHLPLCYYLYALEGALRNMDWRRLTPAEKARLRRDAQA